MEKQTKKKDTQIGYKKSALRLTNYFNPKIDIL